MNGVWWKFEVDVTRKLQTSPPDSVAEIRKVDSRTVEPEEDIQESSVPADGAFPDGCSLRFSSFPRGLSNSLFVGERTMDRLPSTWVGFDVRADDGLCRLVGMAKTTPNCEVCDECEFSSRHHGGAMFLFGDGRVCMISDNVDSAEYQRLANRSSY